MPPLRIGRALAERQPKTGKAGRIEGRKLHGQINQPISRQIENAPGRLGKGIAEHRRRCDRDRRAAGAQRRSNGLIVDKGCRQHSCQHSRHRKPENERATPARRRLRQATESDHRCRERKSDAADPDRALEARRRHKADQHRQQPSPLLCQLREQHASKHDAHRRCHMLRRPRCLEQPAAEARGSADQRRHDVRREPNEDRAERTSRGQRQDHNGGGGTAADPDGESHHQQQRRKRRERGQAGVGLPTADAGHHRGCRGAEVPEIVIRHAPRCAGLAEKRVLRRHTGPDHFVDQRNLRVIEDRRRQRDAFRRGLRHDRQHRHKRQKSSAEQRDNDEGHVSLGQRPRAKRPKPHERSDEKSPRCGQHSRPVHTDHPKQRQRDDAMDRPAERWGPQPGRRRRQHAGGDRKTDQGPNRRHREGAKQRISELGHSKTT